MRHSSFRRRYHPGHRGTPRLLRCEPLEHRWLLSITVDTLVDEADGSIDDGDDETDSPVSISGLTLTGGDVRGEGGRFDRRRA